MRVPAPPPLPFRPRLKFLAQQTSRLMTSLDVPWPSSLPTVVQRERNPNRDLVLGPPLHSRRDPGLDPPKTRGARDGNVNTWGRRAKCPRKSHRLSPQARPQNALLSLGTRMGFHQEAAVCPVSQLVAPHTLLEDPGPSCQDLWMPTVCGGIWAPSSLGCGPEPRFIQQG